MVQSKSDTFLKKRGAMKPSVSAKTISDISQIRREGLEVEIAQGKFASETDGDRHFTDGSGKTSLGVVSGKLMNKQASDSFSYRGSGGTIRQAPEQYSPLLLNSNLNLPRDRAQINAWCRSFFALNPMVHNAISLHSTYPISKLNIKCKDPKINEFFENMIDEIDLMNVCIQVAQEYWCLGEAFVYAELDEAQGKWSRLIIQNPDYITVQRSVVAGESIISLRPDENLKRIVMGNKASDIQQRHQLDPAMVEHVRRGENIPLSNFYVSHIPRKISAYEIRGTGLPVNIFRQLMLFDKLKECKFTQADSMVNPLTLVKVGGGTDGFKPTAEDIDAFRDVFEQAFADKNFKIFTHDGVSVEPVGFGGSIYDISGDIQQLMKEIYIGLWVPSVIMEGGGDVTYQNGGVSLDVLRQRYMSFRNMLSSWLRRKIFAPISKIQGFYEMVEGQKKLIVPEVEWNHMSMFDMGDYINTMIQLVQGDQKKVSLHTLYRSLGLEYEEEMRRIRQENVDSIIQTKELEHLQKTPLSELKSLGDINELKEVNDPVIPGESPFGLPGGPPSTEGGFVGGLGSGLDLGGPPPGSPGGGIGFPPV